MHCPSVLGCSARRARQDAAVENSWHSFCLGLEELNHSCATFSKAARLNLPRDIFDYELKRLIIDMHD
jgi:hypothetical protein